MPMSALGQKQTFLNVRVTSASGTLADGKSGLRLVATVTRPNLVTMLPSS